MEQRTKCFYPWPEMKAMLYHNSLHLLNLHVFPVFGGVKIEHITLNRIYSGFQHFRQRLEWLRSDRVVCPLSPLALLDN